MDITIEDPDVRVYVLSGLHEFATYSLSLAAATAQGIGNRTLAIQRTTSMDGEWNVLRLYCTRRVDCLE